MTAQFARSEKPVSRRISAAVPRGWPFSTQSEFDALESPASSSMLVLVEHIVLAIFGRVR